MTLKPSSQPATLCANRSPMPDITPSTQKHRPRHIGEAPTATRKSSAHYEVPYHVKPCTTANKQPFKYSPILVATTATDTTIEHTAHSPSDP